MLIRANAEIYILIGTFHRHFDLSQIEGNIWDRSQKFGTFPHDLGPVQNRGTGPKYLGPVSQNV